MKTKTSKNSACVEGRGSIAGEVRNVSGTIGESEN